MEPRHGSGPAALAALAIALALTGVFVVGRAVSGTQAPPPPPRPPATSLARPSPTTSALPALTGSQPVRLDIDRIGVHAPVAAAGLDTDGQVAVPPLDQPWLTTWYDRGPSPGERGNSVIIGHVDTRKVGAAVFLLPRQARRRRPHPGHPHRRGDRRRRPSYRMSSRKGGDQTKGLEAQGGQAQGEQAQGQGEQAQGEEEAEGVLVIRPQGLSEAGDHRLLALPGLAHNGSGKGDAGRVAAAVVIGATAGEYPAMRAAP